VGVAVGGVGGVAAVAPHELDRRAVDGHEQRPALGRDRPELTGVAAPEDVGQVDDDGVDPRLLQQRVEPRRVGALRQPEAAAPRAEARPVRGDAGADLQADGGVGRQQREDRVRRRARPRRVRAQRGDRVGRHTLEGARVVAGGPLELTGHVLLAGRARGLRVEAVRRRADVGEERAAAVHRARRGELVAQHGRQRERDRRAAVEQAEQRDVRRRERLPQPLLAERPRPEAEHVRHVRVQDDRQAAARAGHGRSTATRSSARSRSRPARRAKSRAEIAGTKRS